LRRRTTDDAAVAAMTTAVVHPRHVPPVDDAEIVVVAPSPLPRPRIVPRILIGLRAAGRTTKAKAKAKTTTSHQRDEDVPSDLEGGYSSFAQRRSRSGWGGSGWRGRAAPAAAEDGGTMGA
jgi:hypothetical protein